MKLFRKSSGFLQQIMILHTNWWNIQDLTWNCSRTVGIETLSPVNGPSAGHIVSTRIYPECSKKMAVLHYLVKIMFPKKKQSTNLILVFICKSFKIITQRFNASPLWLIWYIYTKEAHNYVYYRSILLQDYVTATMYATIYRTTVL